MVLEAWSELLRALETVQVHHGVKARRYLTKSETWHILTAIYEVAMEVVNDDESESATEDEEPC